MTATQQLELAYMLGASNHLNMVKQAGLVGFIGQGNRVLNRMGNAINNSRLGQMVNPPPSTMGVLGRPPIGILNPALRTPGGAAMQDTLSLAARQRGDAALAARIRASDVRKFNQYGQPLGLRLPAALQVANGPRSPMTGRPGPSTFSGIPQTRRLIDGKLV